MSAAFALLLASLAAAPVEPPRAPVQPAPALAARAASYDVRSPDGRLRVVVAPGAQLTWSVSSDGSALLEPSPISMTLSGGRVLGHGGAVTKVSRRQVADSVRPVVAEKNGVVRQRYRELRLEFKGGWALVVRAYDDGVAYRFATSFPDSVTVESEEASYRFACDCTAVFGADESWMSHQEPQYRRIRLDSLPAGRKGLTPLVLEHPAGLRLAILESGLEDYPALEIRGGGGRSIVGAFAPYPLAEDRKDIENVRVTQTASWIARTAGKREYPWRALAVAADDRALLENQLVYKLAPELRIQDPSWIRPGKVAWDWWNDRNFHDVDFRAGINQRTYEEYVNFASEYGIEYVILDLGWSPEDDLTKNVPGMDVPALVQYAAKKHVGIILWGLWKPLDEHMEEVLDLWQRWGVKGMKIDYMQRDDQAMVQFYWRLGREAAKRHMLVDYHGAYRPGGLGRAYPNVLTREGVRGLEYNKWSRDVTPEHDVTLPFTRMLAGPMDYTPGAMINAAPGEFQPVFSHPMSQGTRAHQLALYVVFESPLQMLADNPQHYRAEPEVTRFIVGVPTTWDETRALLGASGDYLAVARRKGESWWVAALGDERARTLTLDLSFLGGRGWRVDSYGDGVNADRHGSDATHEVRNLERVGPLEVKLAPGGGWVARFSPLGAGAPGSTPQAH